MTSTCASEGSGAIVTIVVSALRSRRSRATSGFNMRVSHEGDACVITVEDNGLWQEDDGEPRGRGVAMMRALSDHCAIERSRLGTRVILRFALAPSIADVALHA